MSVDYLLGAARGDSFSTNHAIGTAEFDKQASHVSLFQNTLTTHVNQLMKYVLTLFKRVLEGCKFMIHRREEKSLNSPSDVGAIKIGRAVG